MPDVLHSWSLANGVQQSRTFSTTLKSHDTTLSCRTVSALASQIRKGRLLLIARDGANHGFDAVEGAISMQTRHARRTSDRNSARYIGLGVCTVAAIVILTLDRAAAQSQPTEGIKNPAAGATRISGRQDIVAVFLKQYCINCHGVKKQSGKLDLRNFDSKSVTGSRVETWQKILDKLASGEMPPKDAQQPPAEERQHALLWIKRALQSAGAAVDESRWLNPSRGNWADHGALFSGKASGQTATRGRLWRLTGKGYEEFVQNLNVKFRLGFRTYGHHRVRSPWELSPHEGFRDYASQHRIGEPEIEHHLRNATRAARAMVARLPKRGGIPELQELLKPTNVTTAAQVKAAAGAAFVGILGRPATELEVDRYAGFLSGNLKTLGPEKAVEQLLVAILFHPEVMYRIELPAAGAKRELLPPRDLARSIAYALTDREPDAELVQAAATGKLVKREDVHVQVIRILEDRDIPKPRVLRFFQEYFGYTAAIDVFKDSATRKAAGFRGKNDWHPNFFVSDADRLVEWILATDKNVLYELLTTTKTFTVTGTTKEANGVKKNADKPFSLFAQTALNIYEIDIPRKEWSDERPFEMPKEHRMGLLTHPQLADRSLDQLRQPRHSPRPLDSRAAARWTHP